MIYLCFCGFILKSDIFHANYNTNVCLQRNKSTSSGTISVFGLLYASCRDFFVKSTNESTISKMIQNGIDKKIRITCHGNTKIVGFPLLLWFFLTKIFEGVYDREHGQYCGRKILEKYPPRKQKSAPSQGKPPSSQKKSPPGSEMSGPSKKGQRCNG